LGRAANLPFEETDVAAQRCDGVVKKKKGKLKGVGKIRMGERRARSAKHLDHAVFVRSEDHDTKAAHACPEKSYFFPALPSRFGSFKSNI
jgi:hypothetical protein